MNKMILANLCLVLILTPTLSSCNDYNSDKKLAHKQPNPNVIETSKEDIEHVVHQIDLGYENFQLISKLNKVNLNSSDTTYSNEFDKWKLVEKDLEGILGDMQMVGGVEWYESCYNLRCYYSGEVENNDIKYEITINAGSYIQLSNSNETLIFIMKKKSQLFVMPCDCCE